ncbi:MAG: hypothetical protein H6569_01775 [Lewinellaceae bacterium]|nr:hypothetical protein [Lewinellaceae bacterium]
MTNTTVGCNPATTPAGLQQWDFDVSLPTQPGNVTLDVKESPGAHIARYTPTLLNISG